MTIRRYYADSYARRFEATVVEAARAGDRPAAVLDESYFYPTSGGQPHDTGRLGSAAVLDVSVREQDGALLHVLDTAVEPGPVSGEIDWARRFDHMQQHSGQHILSQAFLRVSEAPTIGFHLGVDSVSIDLGVPALADAAAADAEDLANQIVTGNAPVRAWFPSGEELRSLALRKTPDVEGPLRVVAMGDFDYSACGGTHVAATGEVGLITLLRTERLKRGIRVEFLCGARARTDYRRKHELVRGLAASLTCAPGELPESVGRMQSALQEARRELSVFRERALDDEARELLSGAPSGARRVVHAAWMGRPIEEVKGLVQRLTATPGVLALLGVAGERTQILFGRSEDVALDLQPAFRAALETLGGGKGGGSRLLQGAAGRSSVEELGRILDESAAGLMEAPRR